MWERSESLQDFKILMGKIELQRLYFQSVFLLLSLAQIITDRNAVVAERDGVSLDQACKNEELVPQISDWAGTQGDCGVAQRQGRRPYQEDRVLCLPEMVLPGLGGANEHGIVVGLFGIFDGHNGAEASEMASTYLPHRLLYHTKSIMDRILKELNPGDASFLELKQDGVGSVEPSPTDLERFGSKENELQEYIAVTENRWRLELGDTAHSALLDKKIPVGSLSRWSDWNEVDSSYSHDGGARKLQNFLDNKLLVESGSQADQTETSSKAVFHTSANFEQHLDVTEEATDDTSGTELMPRYKADEIQFLFRDAALSEELSIPSVPGDICIEERRVAKQWVPLRLSGSTYRLILKEALLRALSDIDFAFSTESRKRGWQAGSTAVVVLKADGHVLVANIGDSKAFICSSCVTLPKHCAGSEDLEHCARSKRRGRKFRKSKNLRDGENFSTTLPCVKELTVDHHPDRHDERARVEAAGGFVSKWGGVPRVNGQLAVTRAIGDISFKKYGVIAEPEFTEWQEITVNDTFLVLASDGIFETMTTQDVCNIQQDKHKKSNNSTILENDCLVMEVHSDLAKAVVDTAFERGSTDNLAAVVYSLKSCLGQQLSPSCGMQDCRSTEVELDIPVQCESGLMQSAGLDLKNGDAPHSCRDSPIPQEENKLSQYRSLAPKGFTPASGMLLKGREDSICYELIQRPPRGVLLPLQTFVEYNSADAGEDFANSTGVEGLTGIYVNMVLPHGKELDMENLHQSSIIENDGQLELYREHHVCLLQPLQPDDKEVCLNPERFASYLRLIEAVPMVDNHSTQTAGWDMAGGIDPASRHPYSVMHQRYMLTRNVGRGGFGEVWFAVLQNCSLETNISRENWKQDLFPTGSMAFQDSKANCKGNLTSDLSNAWTETGCDHGKEFFVLKRILVEKGDAVYLSGMRERYFGEVFKNARNPDKFKSAGKKQKKHHGKEEQNEGKQDASLEHIARYVEFFEVHKQEDFWLVFLNEGHPLSSFLYTVDNTSENDQESKGGHIRVLQPSSWWRWLKTTEAGQQEMRSLIYQLLLGVKACHDRNITHRDIKPENMMVRATSRCLFTGENGQLHTDWPCNLSMHIIDFGSAIDPYSLQHLYSPGGPSRAEQTTEYTPPEAFLQRQWLRFHGNHATMYDMWSIGVVMLELVLGTPHVFQISARTRALLDQRLEGWDAAALDTAYILRALLEMCVLFPGHTAHHQHHMNLDSSNLVSWKCTEENLIQQIKERDPLGIGMPDIWALRLLRDLLQWYPEDRISAVEALQHPYFHPSLQG